MALESKPKFRLLDCAWQRFHFEKVKSRAGTRYSPKLNVELPISEIFNGLTRNREFYTNIRIHYGNLFRELEITTREQKVKRIQDLIDLLKKDVSILFKLLDQIKDYNTLQLPWSTIHKLCDNSIGICYRVSDSIITLRNKLEDTESKPTNRNFSSIEKYNSVLNHLHEAIKELKFFERLSSSSKSKLSNIPILLITGNAGVGKTHLLCDLIEHRTQSKIMAPSILTFGELFQTNEDPFLQIIQQLNISLNKREFFIQLNKLGKASKCRSIIAIDALNETGSRYFWKRYLTKIINEIKRYPHISLILSIRKGFENEILPKSLSNSLTIEEHHGFQFKEWEAVNKYFKEFNIPFPEIPLLLPEFQNPLFLTLFCKAIKARAKSNTDKKNKEVFRGHEGATYIFESYVDSISKKLSKQFHVSNLPGKNLWDVVIESLAAEMVKINSDRINENTVIKIISNAYPSIDYNIFIRELERNFLLVKVPRYSKEKKVYSGFDFRFPFQKFSDHLIGRYIFKQFEKEFNRSNKTLANGKLFFSKRRKLGKYLANAWNRGIVEALSIQCPEHFAGLELIELAPYLRKTYIAKEAFIESLIWRKPTAFSDDRKNTFGYINEEIVPDGIMHTELINAFLSITSVPNHPFNADYLHRYLFPQSLPERDSWWSSNFLHYQIGQRGAVDRLIEWGWSDQDKSHLSNEVIRLTTTTLCWFLTTPNRFLRDKATKALVSILSNRFEVLLALLKQFKEVNDPYVLERLYGVAYGSSINGKSNKVGLKTVALWVYENLFKQEKPPTNILIRDYARGIVELALHERIILKVNRKKFRPPYISNWPNKVPSMKFLKNKYYPHDFYENKTKERGFLDIWSSVMYDENKFGDFGHYVVNSNLEDWSGRRINGTEIDRKKLYNDFKKNLSANQVELLRLATFPIIDGEFFTRKPAFRFTTDKQETNNNKIKFNKQSLLNIQKSTLHKFEASLTEQKRHHFIIHIKPFLSSRGIDDPFERFNTGLAQRWIFTRVIDLGWNPNMHGEFDRFVNNDRTDRAAHKAERIGKKYQWIAFHELLGLISDNFIFKGNSWSNGTEKYKGPWQINVRDIDPTCLLKEANNLRLDEIPFVGNTNFQYLTAWNRKISDFKWVVKSTDLPNPIGLIELVDTQNITWLSLEGSLEWTEETPPEHKAYDLPRRKLWYLINSYLVNNKDKQKVYTWAKKQNFMGRWMPEASEFYNIFLGEYAWAFSYLDHYKPFIRTNGWINDSGRKKIPAQILITTEHYINSGSSFDCSTEESITITLPSKYIIEEMNLQQNNSDGRFFNKDGALVAFNPNGSSGKVQSHVLIHKDSLTKFLKDKDLSIIWTLLGEKQIVGHHSMGHPMGWLEIDGAYTLNKRESVIGKLTSQHLKQHG